ncbi:MAG: thiosulfate oxidation carrier protein SoxY [Alphaproteobacteria bacterium]
MSMRPDAEAAISRRAVLAAAGMVAIALVPVPAAATPEAARALLARLAPGPTKAGRIVLRLPEVADNGASVPMTIAVESPMTADDHVRAIHVVADGNPNPGVATFRLTPMAGKAEVQTRIRLAESQRVTVVAEMSDGSRWSVAREVRVTLGGCAAG